MSVLWRLYLKTAPPWEGCCLSHDRAYWRGGPTEKRLLADIELMGCVARNGHPWVAMLMFVAVRVGGPWWLPFPSVRRAGGRWRFSFDGVRWGYGWKFPRYQELKDAE